MIPAKAAAHTYLRIRSACIITTTAPAQTMNADRAVAALLAERANRAISITSARTDAHFIVLVIICNLNFLYDSSWGEPSATRRTAECNRFTCALAVDTQLHEPAALFSAFGFATQLFRFSLSLNFALSSLLCGALFLRHEPNDAIANEARSSFHVLLREGIFCPPRRTAEASLHRACGSGLRERCRSYLRRAYGRRSFDDLGQRRKDLGVS